MATVPSREAWEDPVGTSWDESDDGEGEDGWHTDRNSIQMTSLHSTYLQTAPHH